MHICCCTCYAFCVDRYTYPAAYKYRNSKRYGTGNVSGIWLGVVAGRCRR